TYYPKSDATKPTGIQLSYFNKNTAFEMNVPDLFTNITIKVWIPASSTGIISFTMSILQYLCSCVSTTFVALFVIQSLC
ncbi:hypothetical protein, partial [Wolbachia endosymbiont of Nasonia vitripennis]